MPYTVYASSYLVLITTLQASCYYLYLTELETGTEKSSFCLISFFYMQAS